MSLTLDLACLAVVAFAAVAGAFAGFIPQVAHLLALAAGIAGARLVGPMIAPLLQGHVPAFTAHPIAVVVAFLLCTALATLVARLVVGATPLRRLPGGRADRGLGAMLGGAQAMVVVWVALSALAVWNRPIHLGAFVADPSRSELVGFARENNAFGSLVAQRSR